MCDKGVAFIKKTKVVFIQEIHNSLDFFSLVFIALPRTSQPCLLVLTQIIFS